MSVVQQFSMVLLGLLLGAQLLRRGFLDLKRSLVLWWIAAVGMFGSLFFFSGELYRTWASDPFAKFFLPPYRDIEYFISYVGVRLFAPWLLSFLAAMLVSRIAEALDKKYESRFFEPEEIPLMAIGIFLSGYPGLFLYVLAILSGGVLLSAYYTLRSLGRAPLYYLWLPAAIFAILTENFLIPSGWRAAFIL